MKKLLTLLAVCALFFSVAVPAPSGTVSFANGGACANDGSVGAPTGTIALNPTILTGQAHAPICLYADVSYGTGAEGLGPQTATNGATSTSSAVLSFAASPSYRANGQCIVDMTNVDAITAGTTISTSSSTTITMSANAVGTGVASGDVIALFTCVGSYSFPAGVTVSASNHQIQIFGNNITLTGIDFSPNGGWWVIDESGSTNLEIDNSFFRTGSNGSDAIDLLGGSVNFTSTGITINGDFQTDVPGGVGAQINIEGGGIHTFNYLLCKNAWNDCVDGGDQSNATDTYNYPAIENNACGGPGGSCGCTGGSCEHPDWIQYFVGTGITITTPTVKHGTFIMNHNAADGTRGITWGDSSFSATYINPVVTDSLFYLPLSGAGGVQEILGGDLAQISTTAAFTNNWILPTAITTNIYSFSAGSGTVASSGNINISSGVSCNGPGSVGSC